MVMSKDLKNQKDRLISQLKRSKIRYKQRIEYIQELAECCLDDPEVVAFLGKRITSSTQEKSQTVKKKIVKAFFNVHDLKILDYIHPFILNKMNVKESDDFKILEAYIEYLKGFPSQGHSEITLILIELLHKYQNLESVGILILKALYKHMDAKQYPVDLWFSTMAEEDLPSHVKYEMVKLLEHYIEDPKVGERLLDMVREEPKDPYLQKTILSIFEQHPSPKWVQHLEFISQSLKIDEIEVQYAFLEALKHQENHEDLKALVLNYFEKVFETWIGFKNHAWNALKTTWIVFLGTFKDTQVLLQKWFNRVDFPLQCEMAKVLAGSPNGEMINFLGAWAHGLDPKPHDFLSELWTQFDTLAVGDWLQWMNGHRYAELYPSLLPALLDKIPIEVWKAFSAPFFEYLRHHYGLEEPIQGEYIRNLAKGFVFQSCETYGFGHPFLIKLLKQLERLFFKHLQATHPLHTLEAMHIYLHFSPEWAIPSLLRNFEEKKIKSDNSKAIDMLLYWKAASIDILKTCIQNREEGEIYAFKALQKLGTPEVIAFFQQILKVEEKPLTVKYAAKSLAHVDLESALPHFTELFNHPKTGNFLRLELVNILGEKYKKSATQEEKQKIKEILEDFKRSNLLKEWYFSPLEDEDGV